MMLHLPGLALAAATLLPAAPPVTVLRGHLTHAPAADTVQVWYTHSQPDPTRPAKAGLSPGGDFELRLTDVQAGSASLDYARQRTQLYLTSGDQLTLTLDFPRFNETVRYHRARGGQRLPGPLRL